MPPAGLQVGQAVRATVLDVDPGAGVVDLSCRLQPTAGAKAPPAGTAVDAKVELIKDHYAVVSVPSHGIGFLAWTGVNRVLASPPTLLKLGGLLVYL